MGRARGLRVGELVSRHSLHDGKVYMHTFRAGHGEDVALEITLQDTPRALVDHEGCLAHESRVQVCLGHDPRWGVGDALHRTVSL